MELSTIYTTLEKLEKMHRSLYELALKKTDLVKENQIELLDQLIKTEQAHVAAIETLENQRKQQVKVYLEQKGVVKDNPTVSDLLDVAKGDTYFENIQNIRHRLIEIVEKLKVQNELNQKLVFQSLQFINVSLQLMKPQVDENINYSNKEVLGQQKQAKKSYFDSQA